MAFDPDWLTKKRAADALADKERSGANRLTAYRVTVITEVPGKRGELSHQADHASATLNYTFSGEFGETLDRATKAYKEEGSRGPRATIRLEELRRAVWTLIRETHR